MDESELKTLETKLTTQEVELANRERAVQIAELKNKTDSLETANKLTDQMLTAWQKLIDMSIHFNEMCLNVRRFALATLATLLAASGVAYRFAGGVALKNPITEVVWFVPIASLFIGTAAVVWLLCYLMDRFWYHELLRGVVDECTKFERKLEIVGIAVTQKIRDRSHASLNTKAGNKLSIFYGAIFLILAIFLLLSLCNPPNKNLSESETTLRQLGKFEAYPLAGLPAFPQGSTNLTNEAKAAICAARAALAAMRVDTALVVGRHDQVELSPETKQRVSSNSGLARARAEQVASMLRDGSVCQAHPVTHVLALDSAPRNVGTDVDAILLDADRKPEIHGLRIISAIPAQTDWTDGK